jgi:Holin of 3TMs, for gene-transfer release
MAIFDALVKPALDSVTALIGQFHMTPEEKAQAQQAVADAAQKAQQAANDYEVQLNTIAGQNIRAEEQSGDKFTVRARPAVIWMGNVLILWNWALVPVLGAKWHMQPVALPDAFWWTWGTVVTGYVFSRGVEKIAALPGDSQIKLPFFQVGNKS